MSDYYPKKMKLEPKDDSPMSMADLIQPVGQPKQEMSWNGVQPSPERKFQSQPAGVEEQGNVDNANWIANKDSLMQRLRQEISNAETLSEQLKEFIGWQEALAESLSGQVKRQADLIHHLYRKVDKLNERLQEIDEKNLCFICQTPWQQDGDHCCASLPCGHLFGKSCVSLYLTNNFFCPYCREVALFEDIRKIYSYGNELPPQNPPEPDN